jgi:Skp family chaperone for outer membrane proteins
MIALLGLMMSLAIPAQTGAAEPKVAVVNVPLVSDGYERTGDLEQEFEVLRVRFNEERNRRAEEINKKRQQVTEQFKPGTEDFLKRQEEIMTLEARLKFFEQSEGAKLEMEIASSLRKLFEDIKRMVSIVATERGFDVVLAAEQLPPEVPDANVLKNQILMQKVLYYSPRVDLTSEVASRLNSEYQARKAQSPAPRPQP